MFIGFSRRLRSMGGFRLGVGLRANKWLFWSLAIFIGMFYLMWYTMIGAGWLIYGLCYLYYWIGRAIYKGVKRLTSKSAKRGVENAETQT